MRLVSNQRDPCRALEIMTNSNLEVDCLKWIEEVRSLSGGFESEVGIL